MQLAVTVSWFLYVFILVSQFPRVFFFCFVDFCPQSHPSCFRHGLEIWIWRGSALVNALLRFECFGSGETMGRWLWMVVVWPAISARLVVPFASLSAISSTFNSLSKVLFIFPSWYLFAIGLGPVFSFRWNLPPYLRSNCEERLWHFDVFGRNDLVFKCFQPRSSAIYRHFTIIARLNLHGFPDIHADICAILCPWKNGSWRHSKSLDCLISIDLANNFRTWPRLFPLGV